MPKRALITGVAGFVGSNLAVRLQEAGWTVWGSYHGKASGLKGIEERALDICLPPAVEALVQECRPDAVFHLAAMADPDACAADKGATRQINVQGAKLVAQAAHAAGAWMVFPSTDQVCDGRRALTGEGDPVDPPGVYGRSKLDAEAAVLAAAPGRALVFRLALTYGWGRGSARGRNFSEKWLRAILTGGRQAAFTDQFRSPIYVDDACEAMRRGVEESWGGVINLAGADRASRYDFAVHLAAEFGFPAASVQAASAADVVFADPRPADSSLSIRRLQGLGFEPRGVPAGLKCMHAELEKLF